MNNSITSAPTAGELRVLLEADRHVEVNAEVSTNGGKFESSGENFSNSALINAGAGDVKLTHTGVTTIGAAIRGGSFTDVGTDGNTVLAAPGTTGSPSIRVARDVKFEDAVALDQNTVIVAGDNVIFEGNVTGAGQKLEVQATGGNVTVKGDLGEAADPLKRISITAWQNITELHNAYTGGPDDNPGEGQSFSAFGGTPLDPSGTISVASEYSAEDASIAFTGNVVLASNTTVSAGGDPVDNVDFGGTVTSPNASTLLVNAAGTTTFHGAVGGTPGGGNELGSLTTDAPGTTAINGGSVTTTAEQAYKDNVTLGANTVLDASAVTFGESGTGKTLTSPNASTLLVNAAGTTTFHGAVGGTPGGGNELGSLTTDAPGTTAINGGSVTTTAEQAYKDNVTLGANTVLDASAVTFGESGTGKTLTSPNASTLLVNAAGTTTFHGAVGGTPGGGNELGSLTTDALGTTAINGGSVTTTAEQA